MKKLITIILILASFFSEGQGLLNIRQRDSTLHYKYWYSVNNPSVHATLRPIYYQELSRNNSTSLKMFVIDTARAALGLKAGYWTDIPAGGSGSPGGSTTQFQYNNAGSFGGVSALTWNGTNVGIALGSDATGDIYYRNSSGFLTRLGIGTTKQKLGVVGGLPTWMDTTAGGGIALTDTYVGVGNGSTISGTANLTHTYASNVSTLKVRAGSSQSTNHLQEWNANDNTLRMAFTSDYKLRLTQTGGGYDQYLSVAQINSLPGSWKWESYDGSFFGMKTTSTDITMMGSSTSQLIGYSNPVLIASGAASPLKVTSSGALTSFEALTYGGVDIPTGLALAYTAKTANYTATLADHIINCTANTFTVTLPDATAVTPKFTYVIKNSGTGVITVATTTSQTIDGITTYTLSNQYDAVTVQSNGANWIIKSKVSASGGSTTPDGNYGNVQLNRNILFKTPASDSLNFNAGLSIKGTLAATSYASGAITDSVLVATGGTGAIKKVNVNVIAPLDTARIVTGPTGFYQSAYSPRSTFMYEKADKITYASDSIITPTVTDSTRLWHIPALTVVASGDLTAETTTKVLVAYTVPNNSRISVYQVSPKVLVTAVGGGGLLTTTCTYTDEGNTSRTVTFFGMGTTTAAQSATGISNFPVLGEVKCYPNTSLSVTTTLTVGTATYTASGTIVFVRDYAQ